MNMSNWILVSSMLACGTIIHILLDQVGTLREQLKNAGAMIGDMAKALKNVGYKNVEYHE